MNLYYYFIEALLLAFILVMARHMWYRARFFLHIFQQVGYKFGEFYNWLKEHWNERVVRPEHVLINIFILILYVFISELITRTAAAIIIIIPALFWFSAIKSLKPAREKKPLVYTPRIYRLILPFGVLCLLLPFLGTQLSFTRELLHPDVYALAIGWALGDVLVPLMLFIAAVIVAPLEKIIQLNFKRKARKKLKALSHVKVIAITGSYGKTSTKFILRDILKERYRVCSTPGSYNTPMGITKIINQELRAEHEFLILEMGARYPGNIEELCDIAQPDISIVTNVGIAHLETFGDKETISHTKEALIRRLKTNGTAVLNADDAEVMKMATRDDVELLTAGLDAGQVRGDNVEYGPEGTRFSVQFPNGAQTNVQTKLLGSHNVQNMLFAMSVGYKLDIRPETMAVAAKQIQPVEHRLELKEQNGFYIIDDAFNSNPVGAENAVEILSRFNSGQKYIITPGMIELGRLQEEANYQFGEKIGQANIDYAVLVGPKQTAPIQQGIESIESSTTQIKVVRSLFEANEYVQSLMQPGDVILYENDLPDSFSEN